MLVSHFRMIPDPPLQIEDFVVWEALSLAPVFLVDPGFSEPSLT
jgi:hypothetical protein